MRELLSRRLLVTFLGVFSLMLSLSLACGGEGEVASDPSEVEADPATATIPVTAIEVAAPTEEPTTAQIVPTNPPVVEEVTQAPTPLPIPTLRPTLRKILHIRVIPSSVNVREEPAIDEVVLGFLYEGDMRPILDESADGFWIRVELASGKEGWVAASVVDVVEIAESP